MQTHAGPDLLTSGLKHAEDPRLAMDFIFTECGVDSSSRFPFTALTNRQTDSSPYHASATAGEGKFDCGHGQASPKEYAMTRKDFAKLSHDKNSNLPLSLAGFVSRKTK